MAQRFDLIYIGIKGAVLALDRDSGQIVWRTELKGTDFVNVMVERGDLFAASRGELYRLNPATGDIMWRNTLPGLGWGLVTVAGGAQAPAAAEKKRRDAAAAAAAASTSAAS
jgi:outer membrane protein assembly factor BamB